MKKRQIDPVDDLEFVSKMIIKGRNAAAFDGIHMINWGSFGAVALIVQYFAEIEDWLPSSVLWLWQPILLIGIVITLFVGRKSLINRMRNPIVRIYSASFSAACLSLFVYAISGLGFGQPDAHTFSVLLCTSLASAFFVMGIATNLRHLLAASAGWWVGTVYFGLKGTVTPIDFIILSGLLASCVVLPGVYLTINSRASKDTNMLDSQHGI